MWDELIKKLFNQSQTQKYCYWDVRSIPDFIITCINLVLASIIMIQVFIAYRREKKCHKSGGVLKIFYFLAAWFFGYAAQYIYGAIVFQIVINKQQIIFKKYVIEYSRVFELLDFFGAFLLLGCLYYVAFLLLKKVYEVCYQAGHRLSKFELYFYEGLKKYQIIRISFIVPTITLFIVPQDKVYISSKIQLALFLLDSILCNVALFIAVRTLRNKNQLLNIDDEREKKKLLKEGLLLQFAGICRFFLGIMFIFVTSNTVAVCPEQDPIRTYLYLLFGQLTMHFLPIVVVLSVFRIPKQQFESNTSSTDDLQTRLSENAA